MNRLILVIILLFANIVYSQEEYKEVQGFYDLSGFEIASGIYLLESKTFFYFASFGNVDLKIFGSYNIQNDSILTFQPDKEFMQEFFVFSSINQIKKDSVTIIYQRPYNEEFDCLTIDEVKLPEFYSEKDKVSISLKKPKSKVFRIKPSDLIDKETHFSIQVSDTMDELLIFHNYYVDMVRRFSLGSFEFRNGLLIDYNREINKVEINEEDINEITEIIEKRKNKNMFNRNGKIYQKLIPNAENVYK